MYIKKCKYCKKAFTAKNCNAVICNDPNCRKAYDKERHSRKKSKCIVCGEEVIGQKKYCSDKCKSIDRFKKKAQIRTCIICGRLYKSTKICCGDECKKEYDRIMAKSKRYTKTCPNCGKEFISPYRKTTYCSLECASQAQMKEVYKENIKRIESKLKEISEDLEIIKIESQTNSYKTANVEILCKRCGQIHIVKGNSILKDNSDRKRYVGCKCSEKTIICRQCGKEFIGYYKQKKICPSCKEENERNKKTELEKQKEIKRQEIAVLKEKQKQEKDKLRKEAIKKYENEERICKYCGNTFHLEYKGVLKPQAYCSDECRKKMQNKKHEKDREKKLKENGEIDNSITLVKLSKKFNNICQICGQPCDFGDYEIKDNVHIAGNKYPSIDHIVPISKGGKHTWDNVQLAHRICNTIKSNKI